MSNNKKNKYPVRCHKCHFYDSKKDTCKNKCKNFNTDFSKCDSFLINEKLVMF